jgi:hypothetical protein
LWWALHGHEPVGPGASGTQPGNRPHLRISLLHGFRLEDGGPSIILTEGSPRLLAFLGIDGRMIRRSVVVGTLWPAATEDRASSNLSIHASRLDAGVRASAVATAEEVGLSLEEISQAPRSWAEKVCPNLIYFNQAERGGHFAAWEEPQLFSEEMRAAFRPLR